MEQTNANILGGKYRILRRIGADGTGTYLSLQDIQTQRMYFSKLIRVVRSDLSAKDLFDIQLKAKRSAAFVHPYITSVSEAEIIPEGILLKQTAPAGRVVGDILQKNGRPLSPEDAKQVALDISAAVAALHSEDIVHGSVDPWHITLEEDGNARLSHLPLPPQFDADALYYRKTDQNPGKADDVFSYGITLAAIYTAIPLFLHTKGLTDAEERVDLRHYYENNLEQARTEENRMILPIILSCIRGEYKDGEELYWVVRSTLEPEQKMKNAQPAAALKQSAAGQDPEPRPERRKIDVNFELDQAKKRSRLKPLFFILPLILILGAAGGFFYLKGGRILQPTEIPDYQKTLDILYLTQTVMENEQQVRDTQAAVPTVTPTPAPTMTPVPTETPVPLPITEGTGNVIRWKADDSQMVSVPEGSFTMGADHTFTYEIEGLLPQHSVLLDGFWINRTEVTQRQYARCVSDGFCSAVERSREENINNDYPMLNVAWEDAQKYCLWAGKRLPTEAEWEKAARGDDRRLYPWGNRIPNGILDRKGLRPVGANPADLSPYGVLDMGGSVSEWTNDFYSDTRMINEGEALINPIGPVFGNMHTVKGGSTDASDPQWESFAFRRWGSGSGSTRPYGFRCVISAKDVSQDNAEALPESAALAAGLSYPPNGSDCENRAGFVADVTIPDGSKVVQGSMITKTWLLKNVGSCTWNPDYKLIWNSDEPQNEQKMFDIGVALEPDEEAEISISFSAQGSGLTRIGFLLADSEGNTFGLGERGQGKLWVEYNAVPE